MKALANFLEAEIAADRLPGAVVGITQGAGGTTWWADPAEDLAVVVMAHTTAKIEPQVRSIVLRSVA